MCVQVVQTAKQHTNSIQARGRHACCYSGMHPMLCIQASACYQAQVLTHVICCDLIHVQVVAIKTMSKVAVIKENQVQHVNDERDMLMHVSGHPFLVNCRGHFQVSGICEVCVCSIYHCSTYA